MDRAVGELERFGQLIGLIYEGATDPSRWTRDILPAVAQYIDSPACILFTSMHTPQDGGYFFMHGIAQDHVDLYMNKFASQDVWTISGIQNSVFMEGNVILGDELVSRSQLLESNFYKECLSRDRNMAQLMTGVVFGAESALALPSVCSFFRGLHHPDFGEQDRERLRLIVPHLSRSLGVMQRLRSTELTMATSLAALDRLASGVLLLNAAGAVEYVNAAARRILAAGDGLRLRKSGHSHALGELLAQDDASNQAIKDAVRPTVNRDPYTTGHFSRSITVPRPSGVESYSLQFSALGAHNEFGDSGGAFNSIIFINDHAKRIPIDPQALEKGYGLTPAEAKVAIALLEFSAAKDVAQVLGISPHTVRTQIRQVYAKLGVDTRTRFVKLMMGLARADV